MRIALLAMLALLACAAADARGHSGAHHASRDGHYAGGHGSSHKGGHYKNPSTGDHYQRGAH